MECSSGRMSGGVWGPWLRPAGRDHQLDAFLDAKTTGVEHEVVVAVVARVPSVQGQRHLRPDLVLVALTAGRLRLGDSRLLGGPSHPLLERGVELHVHGPGP